MRLSYEKKMGGRFSGLDEKFDRYHFTGQGVLNSKEGIEYPHDFQFL